MKKSHDLEGLFVTACVVLTFLKLFVLTGGQRTFGVIAAILLTPYLLYRYSHALTLYVSAASLISGFALAALFNWSGNDVLGELFRFSLAIISCLTLYIAGVTSVRFAEDLLWRRLVLALTFVCVLLGFVDLYYRVYDPSFALSRIGDVTDLSARDYGIEDGNFHSYKFGSIMYFDANYVGILDVIPIFLWIYFPPVQSRIARCIVLTVLFGLLASTFSRTTWGVVAVFAIFQLISGRVGHSLGRTKSFVWLFLGLLLVVVVVQYVALAGIIAEDESGESKIEILKSVSLAFDGSIGNLFFGHGFDQGWYKYSYRPGEFAHGLLSILIGQIGFFGLLVYLGLWLYLMSIAWASALYGAMILVHGFSLIDPWEPTNFFMLGLVAALSRLPNTKFAGER